MPITFEKNNFRGQRRIYSVMSKQIEYPIHRSDGVVKYSSFYITEVEYDRFQKEKTLPIVSDFGSRFWLNEDGYFHRVDGPAIQYYNGDNVYCLNGEKMVYGVWHRRLNRKTIFSAQKIKTFTKLVEIPELYQEVYYRNKKHFISLMEKI